MKDQNEKLERIVAMPTVLAIGTDGKNKMPPIEIIVGDERHIPSILSATIIALVVIQKNMGLDIHTMLTTSIESLIEAANQSYGGNVEIIKAHTPNSPPKSPKNLH